MSTLDELRKALADHQPATSSELATDQYPGLVIARAPARATAIDPLIKRAFQEVEFPGFDQLIPLPSQLTSAQRELAELVASVAVSLHRWAIPQASWARRRWLGLDEPGVLDRQVSYEVDGESRRAPLWRAIAELDDDEEAARRLIEALPVADRFEAWGDLVFDAYRIDPPWVPEDGDAGAPGDWAAAYADRLLAMFSPGAPHVERGNRNQPPVDVCRVVFNALVAAGREIDERWNALIPFDLEVIARLPEACRPAVLVRGVAQEFPSRVVKKGLPAIARFPSMPVLEHLIERFDQSFTSLDMPPRRELFARLRETVADHPELVARIDAHVAELPELPALICSRKHYPESVDELTGGQRQQLAILGRDWHGDDGPIAFEGDDGEIEFGPLQFVSAYEIAGASGEPLFEALLYMDEDGAVCRAGTLSSVAYVCQMRLEWNIDVPTVEALHAILRERPSRRSSPR